MIRKAYHLVCDDCFREQTFLAESIRDAKAEAKMVGWKPGRGRTVYCSARCATSASLRKMSEEEERQRFDLIAEKFCGKVY